MFNYINIPVTNTVNELYLIKDDNNKSYFGVKRKEESFDKIYKMMPIDSVKSKIKDVLIDIWNYKNHNKRHTINVYDSENNELGYIDIYYVKGRTTYGGKCVIALNHFKGDGYTDIWGKEYVLDQVSLNIEQSRFLFKNLKD